MNAIQINFADFVQIQETQPVTTSEFIAQAFGKQHKDVLRKIDEILTQVPDLFGKRNFAPTELKKLQRKKQFAIIPLPLQSAVQAWQPVSFQRHQMPPSRGFFIA